MDKEHARFILRSFRPDGADGADADFAEALRLAAEDRELNAWLAAERAFDASFARALGAVDLPHGLRDDILASMAAERGDLPQAEDPLDAAMIGAVALIHVPPSLREETLAAMEPTAAAAVRRGYLSWRWLALPTAAAAGIALALTTSLQPGETVVAPSVVEAVANEPVPLELVQAGFIRTFESPLFHLDAQRDDHQELVEHLRERKLPCLGKFPRGLKNAKGVGCRELIIDGKHGSLLCFDEQENGTVHLIIFRREDVRCGGLPRCGTPRFTRDGNWAVARWTADGNVFVLLGATEVDRLKSIF